MNKNSCKKLEYFLEGLVSRLQENISYFIDMSIRFKSGTKYFAANLAIENDNVKINFNGDTKDILLLNLAHCICNYSLEYDEVEILYKERGETLLLKADNKSVTMKNIANSNNENNSNKDKRIIHKQETSQIGNRDYFIKIGIADKLLLEIGILGQNNKIKNDKIRKYNQIDHFIEILSPHLENMCKQKESINIVDCGCGKSYLSFVLNYYIKEVLKKPCYFFGIDITESVIVESKRMAKNLGYKNMEFLNCDIKNFKPNTKIDIVISLHACDTATDEALAFGIKNKVSSMIIVPCCHKEFLNQYDYQPLKEILKHGVFKARMADVLTDGMRTLFLEAYGYKVTPVEYISPVDTPKNLMMLAVLNKKVDTNLLSQYDNLSSIFGVNLSLKKLVL